MVVDSDSGDVCDEFHLLLQCSHFHADRIDLIPQTYRSRPNILKLRALFKCKRISTVKNLSLMCKRIMDSFEEKSSKSSRSTSTSSSASVFSGNIGRFAAS